jgi:hypothetical protein
MAAEVVVGITAHLPSIPANLAHDIRLAMKGKS